MRTLQDRNGNGGDRGAIEGLKETVEARLRERGLNVIPAYVHVPEEALYLGVPDVNERDASPTKGTAGG